MSRSIKLLAVAVLVLALALSSAQNAYAPVASLLTGSGNIEVVAGASGHTTLTFHSGFLAGATIDCSGLPLGAIASPTSVAGTINVGDSFTLTVSTSSSTPPGTYPITCGALPPADIISPGFELSSRGLSNGGGSLGPQSISIQQLSVSFSLIVDPAPIPEYPLGLTILAIFMVISYGLIRRRTSTKKLYARSGRIPADPRDAVAKIVIVDSHIYSRATLRFRWIGVIFLAVIFELYWILSRLGVPFEVLIVRLRLTFCCFFLVFLGGFR